ncbi:MAG: hypothetical protein ACNS60_19840 [Candidatus Cyclobacteriaceae bacterium M2_1C_046]
MKEHQLDFGNCYYRPSFFHMKIDLPIDFTNLNEIPDGAFGLYLHEYIHFVQDISTIYGLMNISTITYYIQYCASKIYKDKSQKFEVPIKLQPNTNTIDYGFSNFQLRPIYIGSSIKKKSKSISNFSYTLVPFEFEPGHTIDIVKIQFTDSDTHEIRDLEFGGNHVTEGMAYLCEQYQHKGILTEADAYPYKLISEIVKLEYPEIENDDGLLITICDASLMSYHPGLSFVRLVKFLKEKQVHSSELVLIDIYKECLTEIKGSHVDFEVLVNNVKFEIKKNFSADYYQDITSWIDTIFDRIKIFRKEVPTFVNDMVIYGKPKENQFFAYFLKVIGSPIVIDSNSNATFALPQGFNPTSPNFSPAIFWAINQILKVFYKDSVTPCELIHFCSKSKELDPNINVDENCNTAPWLKATEKNLCPFAQIWHHWALKDYSPNYK